MTELKNNNQTTETRLYAGNFEQVIDQNNKTTNLLYITAPEGLTHIVANGTIYYRVIISQICLNMLQKDNYNEMFLKLILLMHYRSL